MRTYVVLKNIAEIRAEEISDLIPHCAIFEGDVSRDATKIRGRRFVVVNEDAAEAEIAQRLWVLLDAN